ncbi:P-loop containing nucleoside triphosphate hydrolase protein [Mycena crocata]|nr:P-loop containing nucleoside triphosphate hydrolase protein [Mycena crocata]
MFCCFRTLHKIHTYVEAQQDKSHIRQFFRKGEMKILLKDCHAGLQEALEGFKVQSINLITGIADIQTYEEEKHQEVLQLIQNLSEDSTSDRASLVQLAHREFFQPYNSSTSISMLPAEPKIFYGRESELADILNLFEGKSPRIAILGPGGMGKTSLAKAVLHHPQITKEFEQHRFFVVCDSAFSKADLVSLIGAHLGLSPGKDFIRVIIQFLSRDPCLLILDNLEGAWDQSESQRDVEEFLSLLTDVEHMTLLVSLA